MTFLCFLGKSDLQCLWERYSGRQHLFWGLNCIWLDSTISLLISLFTSQSSRDSLRWAGLTLSQALVESVGSVWGSALFLSLRSFTGFASGSLRSSNKKLTWLAFVCCYTAMPRKVGFNLSRFLQLTYGLQWRSVLQIWNSKDSIGAPMGRIDHH